MKMPANAVPDSTVITFVYDKGGQQIEFTADKFPADFNSTTYKLIKRYDKIIRKGKNNQPPIAGFNLSGVTKTDSTQIILEQPYAVILFCEDFSVPLSKWEKSFSALYAEAKAKNIPVYLVTGKPDMALTKVAGTSFSNIQILVLDNTALRTAARTNPCLFVLKQGTILGKWSRHNFGAGTKLLKEAPAQAAPVIIAPPLAADTTTTSNQ